VLNSNTGKREGALVDIKTPAFWQDAAGRQFALTITGRKLNSIDIETGSLMWSFTSGPLTVPPIVINDVVVVGSEVGRVHFLDAASGSEIWSTNAGAPINKYVSPGPLWVSLGAGQDTLVVPASTLVAAYAAE